MKIHREFEQGSLAWLCARAGVPTASDFDKLVTPRWKVRTGEMVNTLLAVKLAEKWLDGPLPEVGSFAMEEGTILEDEAIPWLSLLLDKEIERVGFITTDDEFAGCSPDGWMDGVGVEIKCPRPTNHVKYLLAGEVPEEYQAQVQGSLYVTQAASWKFVSYSRRFPKLVLDVEPIPEAQEAIQIALRSFNERFNNAMGILLDKNGGKLPPRRAPLPADAYRTHFEDADNGQGIIP